MPPTTARPKPTSAAPPKRTSAPPPKPTSAPPPKPMSAPPPKPTSAPPRKPTSAAPSKPTSAPPPKPTSAPPPKPTSAPPPKPASTSMTSNKHPSTTTHPPPPPYTYHPPPVQPGNTSPYEPPVVTITAAPLPNENSASPEPALSITSTSIYTTLFITTSLDGGLYTTTIRATIIIVPSTAPSSGSRINGPLTGGIAGGAGGLIVIIILGLLYWRRNRNRRRPASGVNPDRDRAVQIESHTGIAGAEVTEFQYAPGVGGSISGGSTSRPNSPTFSGNSSMRQYRDSQALLSNHTPEGGGAPTATSGSQSEPSQSEGHSARLPSGRAGSSSPRRTGLDPSVSRVKAYRRKEHGSLRKHGDLRLVSAPEEGEVIRHMDGGHGSEAAPPSSAQEIPPSYQSIPAQ